MILAVAERLLASGKVNFKSTVLNISALPDQSSGGMERVTELISQDVNIGLSNNQQGMFYILYFAASGQ